MEAIDLDISGDGYVTAAQLSMLLLQHLQTVRKRCRTGEYASEKMAGRIMIPMAEARRLLPLYRSDLASTDLHHVPMTPAEEFSRGRVNELHAAARRARADAKRIREESAARRAELAVERADRETARFAARRDDDEGDQLDEARS